MQKIFAIFIIVVFLYLLMEKTGKKEDRLEEISERDGWRVR